MASDELEINFADVLASTAHDMKNSISTLIYSLDEIMATCKNSDCKSYDVFPQLKYEAKRLTNDLVQMLTLYKMRNSQYCFNISYNSLSDFIAGNMLHHKSLLAFKGIDVVVECSEDLCWFFDRELVSGVFNNIINNLFRYTKDKIKIAAQERDGYLVISIDDNGNGYPEFLLTAETPVKDTICFETGSTGLGLYFASRIAEMHRDEDRKGFISVSNDAEAGAGRFEIFLP